MFNDASDRGYYPCEFDKRFVIWRQNSIYTWELCLAHVEDEDGYPKRIGRIEPADMGSPVDLYPQEPGVIYLNWEIQEDYRGQGIMSNFLALYLQNVDHRGQGFGAALLKTNVASHRLALKNNFELRSETDTIYVLKRV